MAGNRKSGRWSGQQASNEAGGEAKARSDRKLQRNAERTRAGKSQGKKASATQVGQRRYPEPPLPPEQLRKPGLESELEPRPRYEAPEYRGSGKLDDKVALITGGDSGIGRAVAVLFAREGADVALVYLDEDSDADETRQAIEAEGRRAILIPGDVTDPDFCRDAVETTVRELDQLDILVNNAAFQEHVASLEDLTDEQLDRTFRTNIFGYFYMARAALAHLREGGSIINTGSVTGIEGSKELLDYASTKGAIHAFTKSLAQNLVDRGIRVNCVAPGPVWTPLNPADQDPEKVAPAYVFFAAPVCSSFITGEVLPILGGETVGSG